MISFSVFSRRFEKALIFPLHLLCELAYTQIKITWPCAVSDDEKRKLICTIKKLRVKTKVSESKIDQLNLYELLN